MSTNDYYVIFMVLGFSLPFAVWALTEDWCVRRERRRRKELADKLHL